MNKPNQSSPETISTHERTVLESVDHDAFFAALNAPPKPTEALRSAFERRRDADSRIAQSV